MAVMEQENYSGAKQSMAIPVAIIVGFGLIALAIFFSDGGSQPNNSQTAADNDVGAEEVAINPVVAEDHIRGNPNAKVVVVEYSDYDCPFCKAFHETMGAIMDEFGSTGDVAWVYRHFPLASLHPSAPYIAEASECVASLGGNEAFWTFSDLVFGERGQNELTNVTRLDEFAETAGVDVTAFNSCLDSNEMRPEVEEDFDNAVAIGARGTPYSVIVFGDQQLVINGAQPYNVVRQMIQGVLNGTN